MQNDGVALAYAAAELQSSREALAAGDLFEYFSSMLKSQTNKSLMILIQVQLLFFVVHARKHTITCASERPATNTTLAAGCPGSN